MRFDPSLTEFPTVISLKMWLTSRWVGAKAVREMIEASGLPPALRGLVRDVTRRTRLWPSEQREVARELITHFQDGLDAGRSEEELAGEFGDGRRASRLIRRTKRRGRPRAWRVWNAMVRFAGASLLVLIVGYAWLGYRYWTAHATISRDYLAEHNDRVGAIPADHRAWPLYRRAALMRPVWPPVLVSPRTGHPGEPSTPPAWGPDITPDSEFWPVMVEYNRACQPMLEVVREAAGRTRLGADWKLGTDLELFEHEQKVLGRGRGLRRANEMANGELMSQPTEEPLSLAMDIPSGRVIRGFVRDLTFDMRRAEAAGDETMWMEDARAMLGMIEQLGSAELDVDVYASCELLGQASQNVGETLAREPEMLSDLSLRELAHRLGAIDLSRGVRELLPQQTMMFDDLLQHWFTNNGQGQGRITPMGLRELSTLRGGDAARIFFDQEVDLGHLVGAAGPALSISVGDRVSQRREFARLQDLAREEMSKPMWLRQDPVVAELDRLGRDALLRVRFGPILAFAPNSIFAANFADLAVAKRDGLMIAIACELHRRRHGSGPETIDALVPGFLPAAPIDPWCGKALRMVMRDGRPVIYSTGPDGVDDNGMAADVVLPSRRNGAELWIGANAPRGKDWVIWPPAP